MTRHTLTAAPEAPSNVIPWPMGRLGICAAETTLDDICAGETTAPTGQKASNSNVLQATPSSFQVNGHTSAGVSSSRANPMLPRKEFLALVDRLSAMELRERFPLEATAHRDMVSRRLKQYEGCAVAPEFRNFRSFLRHMGQRPSADWTLDRKNPARLEYGPELCRWADKRQQANNRRTTLMLSRSDGEARPLTDWARLTSQDPKTMRKHLDRGWTHDEVIAGKRAKVVLASAPGPAPINVYASGWPTGTTASWWEDGFRRFAVHFDAHAPRELPDLDRDAFFWWLGGNRHADLWRSLRQRHAWCFEPNDDPPPDEVTSDPEFIAAGKYQAALREVGIRLASTPKASRCAEGLREMFPAVLDPADPRLGRLFTDRRARIAQEHRRAARTWDVVEDVDDDDDVPADLDLSTEDHPAGPVAPVADLD